MSAVTQGLAGGVVVAICNWLEEMLEIAMIGRISADQPVRTEMTAPKLHRKKRWKAPKQARRTRKLNDRPTARTRCSRVFPNLSNTTVLRWTSLVQRQQQ